MTPQPGILGTAIRHVLVVVCAVILVPGDALADIEHSPLSQNQAPASQQQASAPQQQAAKIPPDQLDSLVAPIALYPDPMLAQVLAASTYPLQIIQLHQWLEKRSNGVWPDLRSSRRSSTRNYPTPRRTAPSRPSGVHVREAENQGQAFPPLWVSNRW